MFILVVFLILLNIIFSFRCLVWQIFFNVIIVYLVHSNWPIFKKLAVSHRYYGFGLWSSFTFWKASLTSLTSFAWWKDIGHKWGFLRITVLQIGVISVGKLVDLFILSWRWVYKVFTSDLKVFFVYRIKLFAQSFNSSSWCQHLLWLFYFLLVF